MAGFGSVIWFELPADDVARARNFYGELFGWRFSESVHFAADYWSVEYDDDAAVPGGILPRPPGTSPGSGPLVYFHVADLDASTAEAVRLGGTVVRDRTVISPSSGSFTLVRDTEGNTIGLWAR